jgi:hypothetical protein
MASQPPNQARPGILVSRRLFLMGVVRFSLWEADI